MNARYDRVLVVCPAGAMTAGPEALHQLVAELNEVGQPAAIVYHPFDSAAETPEPYRKYGAPVARFAQDRGTLVIYPEVHATLALRPSAAESAVWWMSVNNYTGVRYLNPWRDRLRYAKYVLKGRAAWQGVKAFAKVRNFAQSDYARAFLASHGVAAEPLWDPIPVYTEPAYVERLPALLAAAQRHDTILYNPLKGAAITAKLVAAYPQWTFAPLRGLDRGQLAQAFLAAKLYMDFGHHPGKDRLPREAALHGCCVVTANHGSAANAVDVPIPADCKLDAHAPDFVERFGSVAGGIFSRFDERSGELAGYRETIAREPAVFREHVRAAFLR